MLLRDKVAVATGASNGIGKSIDDVFIENGAKGEYGLAPLCIGGEMDCSTIIRRNRDDTV